MMDREWLEGEIKILQRLEEAADLRLASARRAHTRASEELLAAQEEVQSLRVCQRELQNLLNGVKERESEG